MKYNLLLSLSAGTLFLFAIGAEEALSKEQNSQVNIPAPEFSVAGFLPNKTIQRKAHDFNIGWRFLKGNVEKAEQVDFDDSTWEIVNVPHGLELTPEESSGCSNYQGEAWYRKHFDVPAEMKGRRVTLYFEGIMGKSKIYVNGKLLKEHFGGYLPAVIDVTEALEYGKPNVVAVWADNGDDPHFPPGKPQSTLDFNYFGGIYRDAYLIETNKIYITDPNEVNEVAGGGVFFYTKESNQKNKTATVGAKIHLKNDHAQEKVTVSVDLKDRETGTILKGYSKEVDIAPGTAQTVQEEWQMNDLKLWSIEHPSLYDLIVTIKDAKGQILDDFVRRVGIRTFTMDEENGLSLNGEPYQPKLIGGNRHQDFAILGNAVANVGQWRDAKKLKDAGFRVVRSAHYPQDPAFMDACDELGLFVMVATPGWQFWNKEGLFEGRVYQNIRDMVRRDRNHPSVWVWEPILNETHYPADFARNVLKVTHEEFPVGSCYAASDSHATGSAEYDLIFSHPPGGSTDFWVVKDDQRVKGKAYFTREFGDCVDTWSAHNSPSRASKRWGELAMIQQAVHYIAPDYKYATSTDLVAKAPKWLIGGTIWHPFDHQRGYHSDPFYGGIMDGFRQPKMSYYAFQAQNFQRLDSADPEGARVYLAHGMTTFSPKDVTVFSNCQEVRLTAPGKPPVTKKVPQDRGLKAPPVVFENAYSFDDYRKTLYTESVGKEASMLIAEGLIDGKVVATDKRSMAMRPTKISLKLDNEGIPLRANGTDFAVLVATVTDDAGTPKTLHNESIRFEIEGEGVLVGDESVQANPQKVEWGTAPIIIRSTTKAGKVRVTAHVDKEGGQKPQSCVFEYETIPEEGSALFKEVPEHREKSSARSAGKASSDNESSALKRENERLLKELNLLKNKEVERQQKDFDGTKK